MKIIVSFLSLLLFTTAASYAQNIPVAEANTTTLTTSSTSDFTTVLLNLTFSDPVVFAQPPSYNDSAPAHVRLRNVGVLVDGEIPAFEMKIEEWRYLDGVHATETVGYLVFEAGEVSSLDGSKIAEAGKVTVDQSSAGTFTSVQFNSVFIETPVLFAQVQTYNGTAPVVVRIKNVTTTGFEVLVQEEEGQNGIHNAEEVGYLAFVQGEGELLGIDYEAGTQLNVDENFSSIEFDTTTVFAVTPVFIATMQTYNGSDPTGLRYRNLAPTGAEVFTEEEASSDAEIAHADEDVGYLAIESGTVEYPDSLLSTTRSK